MLRIIERRWISYVISGLLAVAAIVSLASWGLRYGIDFTGGSLLEVRFTEARPSVEKVQEVLKPTDVGSIGIQPVGTDGFLLRFRDVDEIKHQQMVRQLGEAGAGKPEEQRFESVGPTIGGELQRRALWAIVVALIFIVSYIAWAFRKVSHPIASWKYGVAAVIALGHDVLILLGTFSLLGHFRGVEVDALFVSAVLTVLGFSVHDTIVVFDRIRENLFRHGSSDFVTVVNLSVNETIVRSINTSFTTLLVLTALFFFGGDSIHYFAFALMVGITVGTYSSIFIASTVVVDWNRLSKLSPAGKRR